MMWMCPLEPCNLVSKATVLWGGTFQRGLGPEASAPKHESRVLLLPVWLSYHGSGFPRVEWVQSPSSLLCSYSPAPGWHRKEALAILGFPASRTMRNEFLSQVFCYSNTKQTKAKSIQLEILKGYGGGLKKDSDAILLQVPSSFMCKFCFGPYQLHIKAFSREKNTQEENRENIQAYFMPSYLSSSEELHSPWLAQHRLACWLFPLRHRQLTSNKKALQNTHQTGWSFQSLYCSLGQNCYIMHHHYFTVFDGSACQKMCHV